MKKTLLTILYITAFVGGFLALFLSGPKEQTTPIINQVNQQTSAKPDLETKTDKQASVTVTVAPVNIFPQSKELRFNVLMDTHSVELDQDMAKISVLIDGQGKEYKPVRWEGAEAGGHHREGVLIFTSIVPYPQNLKLVIKNIAGVPRSFLWTLVGE